MKKILFVLLLLFPFMVRAVENVKITNIEQLDKSEYVTINTEPTFEGLKINFDFKFTNLDVFVKYKVTIKNEDNKEYEIESGVKFNEGEYLKYEFGMNGESAIIKPNETKSMILLITYVKEPSPDKFVDGKYVEQNAMSIDLSTKEDQHSAVDPASQQKENNPKTGAKGIIILIAVLLGILLLICFIEKKNAFFLIALFLIIPITIKAIEKITLQIETKVEIGAPMKYNTLVFVDCGFVQYEYKLTYQKGMTWEEFTEADYISEIYDYNVNNHNGLTHLTFDDFQHLVLRAPEVKDEAITCMTSIPQVEQTGEMSNEEYNALMVEYEQQIDSCIETNLANPNIDLEAEPRTGYIEESEYNYLHYDCSR